MVLGHELFDDGVLGIVGVLVLIDQHKLKLLLVAGQHVGVVAKELIGIAKQVIEIHGVGLSATGHIALVDVAHQGNVLLLVDPESFGIGCVGLGRGQTVLCRGDTALHQAGLIDLLVELHLLEEGTDQALAVGGIVDGEVRGEAQHCGLGMKDTEEDAVEGAHPEACGGLLPHPACDTFLHLAGSLVGEGQG